MSLQQITEIQVLLVCHIRKTSIAVSLGTNFLIIAVHRIVDEVPGETCGLALIALLLLQPGDVEELQDDYTPKNAPDDQDSLEGIDLQIVRIG